MGYYLGIFLTIFPTISELYRQTNGLYKISCLLQNCNGFWRRGPLLFKLHCTKNWIYTNLLGANTVQKMQTRGKSKAKMVNTAAVSSQFNCGCKFEGKCGIYHLCPLHFFALKLHQLSKFGVNQFFVHC